MNLLDYYEVFTFGPKKSYLRKMNRLPRNITKDLINSKKSFLAIHINVMSMVLFRYHISRTFVKLFLFRDLFHRLLKRQEAWRSCAQLLTPFGYTFCSSPSRWCHRIEKAYLLANGLKTLTSRNALNPLPRKPLLKHQHVRHEANYLEVYIGTTVYVFFILYRMSFCNFFDPSFDQFKDLLEGSSSRTSILLIHRDVRDFVTCSWNFIFDMLF